MPNIDFAPDGPGITICEMNVVLFFVVIGLAIIILAPLVTPGRVLSRIPPVLRILLGLIVLGFAGFCGFGFLATFEPLDPATQWSFRIGYVLAGAAALTGAIRFFRIRKPAASL